MLPDDKLDELASRFEKIEKALVGTYGSIDHHCSGIGLVQQVEDLERQLEELQVPVDQGELQAVATETAATLKKLKEVLD